MNFMLENYAFGEALIKVVGVGGGGCNAVNSMIEAGIRGVEYIAMNTDSMALNRSMAAQKVQLGEKLTRGFGAGADPEIGRQAAEESREEIVNVLRGAQMVFVTAGMGGGTGTGAAPIIAGIARELEILTVGVVTKPFDFEGDTKMHIALAGVDELVKNVDSLVVIPNERLIDISESSPKTLLDAFEMANDVLRQAVRSISDLLNIPGFINLDFRDIERVMRGAGYAHMGVGRASGRDKADVAAAAERVLVNITSSLDLDLNDVQLVISTMRNAVSKDALIIWGHTFDDTLQDEMVVSLIATGSDDASAQQESKQPAEAAGAAEKAAPTADYSADSDIYKILGDLWPDSQKL